MEKEFKLEELLEMASLIEENEDDFIEEGDEKEDVIFEDDLNEMEELSEDQLFEDEASRDDTMTDEELKIEALKVAINIAKLMSDVTTEDVVSIADKVAKFIRDHQIGGSTTSEESDENPEEFTSLDDNEIESDQEENDEE